MAAAQSAFSGLISLIFEYDTPKIVHIRSKKVGIINRFIQLCIIAYVIGYAIVFEKGYQDFESVTGAITTKVKGVARTYNLTPPTSARIWDVSDYVVPPQENNALFVITNLIITNDQRLGKCEEDISIPGANCTMDNICQKGEPLMTGDGFMTGKCLDSQRYPGNKSCEVNAWCPTENGNRKPPNPPSLATTENFTVFIKNNIEFPKFNVKRRNILGGILTDDELKACRFNKDDPKNQFCPIFLIKDILEYAGVSNFSDIAVLGGVIQIVINWECNLDYGEDDCVPEYSFRRLDQKDEVPSKGYNFRFARYYKDENGTEYRTLFKAYGIKFIMTLQGQAGKFSTIPMFMKLGSGLAILSVATLICDFFVLYFLKARHMYRENKYLQVVGEDAYKKMGEDEEEEQQSAPS